MSLLPHIHSWGVWPWCTNRKQIRSQTTIKSYGIIAFSRTKRDEKYFLSNTCTESANCCSDGDKTTYRAKIIDANINVLLVQKRMTNALHDILMGRYSTANHTMARSQLITLLSELTCDERWRIMNSDFDTVAADLFVKQHRRRYLKATFRANQRLLCTILASLYPYLLHYTSTEYEFPKGRRDRETPLMCAIREFCEETSYSPAQVKLLDPRQTVEEYFIGSDGNRYCHVYYIAIVTAPLSEVIVNRYNKEIKGVGWYSLPRAFSLLRQRKYEITKLTLLTEAYKLLTDVEMTKMNAKCSR